MREGFEDEKKAEDSHGERLVKERRKGVSRSCRESEANDHGPCVWKE